MVKYSDEIAEEICNRIADGESLRGICNDPHMPSRPTVAKWMDDNPDFFAKCARARVLQAEAAHDQMILIEDGAIDGSIPADVARVVLSSKQWRASKLNPKKYGDKITQQLTGPEGGAVTFVLGVPRLPDDPVDE